MTKSKQFRKQVRQLANQYGLKEGFRAYGENLKSNRFRLKMLFENKAGTTAKHVLFREDVQKLVDATPGVEVKFGAQSPIYNYGLVAYYDKVGSVVNLYFEGNE